MVTPALEMPLKHQHAVQFYGTDESLFVTVSSFLAEGLVQGQPAIMIATRAHQAAIEEHLRGRMIDCAVAKTEAQLLILDADETLDLFMVDGEPDPDRFEAHVGAVIGKAVAERQATVRAYGEMVDVLWKRGESQAAINLEILWNKLALKHNFALLCGYAMGSFYKQTHQLDEIAALHSHVIDTNVIQFPTPERRSA